MAFDYSTDQFAGDANVTLDVDFRSADKGTLEDVTIREVVLGESLLTPGLQTSIVLDSFIHTSVLKNFDIFKNSGVIVKINKPQLERARLPSSMLVGQQIYRLENRRTPTNSAYGGEQLDDNNEQFTLRACDPSLLYDAKNLVSKSWKCTQPNVIVDEVLRTCAGAQELDIQPSAPARDYIAENIHPFQVVNQQTNVALDGDDPSFLHYMTYNENSGVGIHHFRSLKYLCAQPSIAKYHYSQYQTYKDPNSVMQYSFPCDFDILSDLLNGVDENGNDISSLIVFNPVNKMFSLIGSQTVGCGIGTTVVKYAQTNINTAQNQNSCNFGVEKYRLKRQARMGLLEKDKIALRITVPWNPSLHAGKTIDFEILNKSIPNRPPTYGSGKYLILHMMHIIRRGGYAITKLDCVSETAGRIGSV
jgi:hypothetical protein